MILKLYGKKNFLFLKNLLLDKLSVERRRRDKINNWIVTLSKIIPDCNMDSTKTGAVSIFTHLHTAANIVFVVNCNHSILFA